MNATTALPPSFFTWPSTDEVVDYASKVMNSLFNGAAYERSSTLPKLLHVPELWHMPGEPGSGISITESILADLEGLLAAQVQHLQRGRIHLFDPARFWVLIEAVRGEKQVLEQQIRRQRRSGPVSAVDIETALQAANDRSAIEIE